MYGCLIDMDGVIYRGNQLIPGADRFIHQLRVENVPFRFLTNNSQRNRLDVAMRHPAGRPAPLRLPPGRGGRVRRRPSRRRGDKSKAGSSRTAFETADAVFP